jgi:ABC superfamily ATP binding cassette transporter, ABC protein
MIKVENICKKIKNNEIIKNISYQFDCGKIYGLYGRNGSGKTVFLKLLSGFYKLDSGSVLYDGVSYSKNNVCKDVRVLIDGPSFYGDLSGYDNLKLLADINKKISNKEIDDILKVVNLYDEKDKKYSKYSLGMKQKLGIAQALMENTKYIFLDEPFNGVEEATVTKLIDYIKSIKKDKVIIISTHIKEDLDNISDVIIKIEDGKIC